MRTEDYDQIYRRCAELERELEAAEQKALYYQILAEQAGQARLRETEALSRLLAEHIEAQEALAKSTQQLRQIIDLVPHMIFVKNQEGRFLLANAAVAKSLHTTVDELTGKLHADVHPYPEEVTQMLADDLTVIESGHSLEIPEERFTDAYGDTRWLQVVKVPYVTADTSESAVLGVAIDITEQKRTEMELQRHRKHLEELVNERTRKLQQEIIERQRAENQLTLSLQEKDILLKEIHHRVKNNLQVISSLLNLQASLLPDEYSRNLFQESRQRVRTMALIHEKLYQSESLGEIDFQEYVGSLASELSASYQPLSGIVEMVVDVADIHLDLDTAIPCGLVLTELLSNALKYGVPSENGKIMLTFSATSGHHYELRISDNGAGLPAEIQIDTLDSLGLQLVKGLVEEQLNGTLELMRSAGTTWIIRFQT